MLVVWEAKCGWCNREIQDPNDWQADHFIPHDITKPEKSEKLLAVMADLEGCSTPGGLVVLESWKIESLENMCPMHNGCNREKSDDILIGDFSLKAQKALYKCIDAASEIRRIEPRYADGSAITRAIALLDAVHETSLSANKDTLARHIVSLLVGTKVLDDFEDLTPITDHPASRLHRFDPDLLIKSQSRDAQEWRFTVFDGKRFGETGSRSEYYCRFCRAHTLHLFMDPPSCKRCGEKNWDRHLDPDAHAFECGPECYTLSQELTPEEKAAIYEADYSMGSNAEHVKEYSWGDIETDLRDGKF